MLCSLVTPGLAGKYEDEFLAEVKRGCPSLLCVPNPVRGGHWTTKTRETDTVIGVETYYVASDSHTCPVITYEPRQKNIVKTIYTTEKVWRDNDLLTCLNCKTPTKMTREAWRYAHPGDPKFSVKTSDAGTTIHMEPNQNRLPPCKAYYKGSFSNPHLAKVCCQEAGKDLFSIRWDTLLVALWNFAVKLDDEESGKKTFPQNSTTEIVALKREVVEDTTSCIIQ